MLQADPSKVSQRAKKRGLPQVPPSPHAALLQTALLQTACCLKLHHTISTAQASHPVLSAISPGLSLFWRHVSCSTPDAVYFMCNTS